MRFSWLCLCLLLFRSVTHAQASGVFNPVTETEARQHLLQHSEPIYPAIAQAARVQGDIKIEVGIDIRGRVASQKVVSGPTMLRQSALESVKTWQFAPFKVDGKAASVMTTLLVPFRLEKSASEPSTEQQKAAQDWFPLSDKCQTSIKAHRTDESVDNCKQALEMSLKAGDLTSSDQLSMVDSREEYGRALLAAGRLQEAFEEESKAIDLARAHLRLTDQEYAMPFYWRALVEESLGQPQAASADFTTAEETHRRAMAHLPEMKQVYGRYLAAILKQHAALLDQMGRSSEADKLRVEAGSL